MKRILALILVVQIACTWSILSVFERAMDLHRAGRISWAWGPAEPALVSSLWILLVGALAAVAVDVTHEAAKTWHT